MVLKEDLQAELKEAMRSGDHLRRDTIRMALAAIKLTEVEKRVPLDESAVLSVLQKEVKIQLEAIEDAKKAGRQDLIKTLEAGQKILESYLPEPLSEEEVTQLAQDVIKEIHAQTPQEMGKVMKVLMPRVQGRADGKIINQIVRSLLLKE
ncbi:MAG: hypothetical protein A2Z14_18595 [Chloroflexi bacterium RBG_16_48_8]|nr:MAG: hypothetical protein A2Z14_18595 [Chloroflexi bacterium RBG_16_48_8]